MCCDVLCLYFVDLDAKLAIEEYQCTALLTLGEICVYADPKVESEVVIYLTELCNTESTPNSPSLDQIHLTSNF